MIGTAMRAAAAGATPPTWHTAFPWAHSWLADDLTAGTVAAWPSGSSAASADQATGTKQPTQSATSGANSQPGVTFDGVDDYLQAAFTTIAQPNSIVVIGRHHGDQFDSGTAFLVDSAQSTNRQLIGISSLTAWSQFAGTLQTGGTPDTSAHTFTGFYNGASSVLEIDGASVIAANCGSQSLGNGLTMAARYDGAVVISHVTLSAVGVYSGGDARSNGAWSGLVSLVASKWALTL